MNTLRRVVADLLAPVWRGRIDPRAWPPLIRFLGVVTLALVLGGIGLVIGSDALRASSPLVVAGPDVYLPGMTLAYLAVAAFVALVLLQVAVLQAHWAVRLVGLVAALGAFFASTVGLGSWAILGGIAWVGLIVVHGFAWRTFRTWQVVAVAIIVFVGTQVPRAVSVVSQQQFGYDFRGIQVSAVVQVLATLAIPSLMVAGAALTQVAVSVGESVGRAIGDQRPRALVLGVLVVALGWLGYEVVSTNGQAPASLLLPHAVGALVLLLGTGAVAWPFLRRAARRGGRLVSTSGGITEPFAAISYALAIPTAVWMLLATTWQNVSLTLTALTGWVPPPGSSLMALTVGVAALPAALRVVPGVIGLIIAWRWAGRGQWVPALILSAFTVPQVWMMAGTFLPGVTLAYDASSVIAWLIVAIVGVGGWLASRRQLAGARLTALLVAALILLAHQYRDILDQPVTLLVGSATVAAIAVGLVWRALTDGEFTRASSPALPQISRVLLYLASLVFATLAVTYNVVSRDYSSYSDLSQWEEFGDQGLALPLVVSSVLISLVAAVRQIGHPSSTGSSAPGEKGERFVA